MFTASQKTVPSFPDMSSDIAQADALAIILTVTTTLVIMLYERTFREKRVR